FHGQTHLTPFRRDRRERSLARALPAVAAKRHQVPLSQPRGHRRSTIASPTAATVSPISHHGGPGAATDQRSNQTGPGAKLWGAVTVQNEPPSGANASRSASTIVIVRPPE